MSRNSPWADVPAAPVDLDVGKLAKDRDVELDVGFGRGHFLIARATARPKTLVLGLEMRRKWVGLAAERAAQLQLENVLPWYGDARFVLNGWQPGRVLSAVFVNFPDPWWKKKHLKRLVISKGTVSHIARLLKPGGVLLVQTDVEERALAYRPVLEGEPLLREALGSAEAPLDRNPLMVQSHREKKCAEASLPVHRFLFERIS